jgi:hypothetical protein
VDSDPRRRWTGRGGPEAQGRPRGARVSVTDGRWTRRVQRDRPRHRLRARARWSAAGHDSDSRGGGARLARTRTHSRFSTRQPTCVRPPASATATTRPAPTMLMVHVALLWFCSVSRQAQLSCTIRVQMQRCTSFWRDQIKPHQTAIFKKATDGGKGCMCWLNRHDFHTHSCLDWSFKRLVFELDVR